MLKKKFALLILTGFCLNSCANDGTISKQGGGAALGAVTGGLVGSLFGKGEGKILAIGAGALLGGFAGSAIGKSMDDQDKRMAEDSAHRALESAPVGRTVEWKNPDSGHYGSVTPTRTFQATSGQYCREYNHTIDIGGNKEKAYGTACRKPDGSWEIVSSGNQ
ncbi:MAG: glycine zipper 2TM domain-containing protein [Alphaproteobacteria bacterium]|nr:glycine zipper 2TM domain-containing protein [Alphaproteobacteria bacterium]